MVGPRRVQDSFADLGSGTETGPAPLLLSSCFAERCVANQGLTSIGPTVGMSPVEIVVVEEFAKPVLEILWRTEVPASKESAGQNTKPQFHLVQPRSVLGSEMKHVLVRRVCQEGAAFFSRFQSLGQKRDVA